MQNGSNLFLTKNTPIIRYTHMVKLIKPTHRLGLILFIVLAVLFSGCVSKNTVPSPITKKLNEKQFPTRRYIVGKGCVAISDDAARDRLAADQAARAEIVKQIEVKIVQIVEDIQKEEQQNERRTASYSVKIQTREMVDKTLTGVKIVDQNRDKTEGTQCSTAVLDKMLMASRIKENIEKVKQEIGSYLSTAEEAGKGGDSLDALRCTALAMLSLDRIAVKAKMLLDLGYGLPEIPSRIEIWKKWKLILEGIIINPLQGNVQRAKPNRPLPDSLVVQVLDKNSNPLINLPLTVLRLPQDCQMQTEVLTDKAGKAFFKVFLATSSTSGLGEIAIGIDWERLLTADQLPLPEKNIWKTWDAREAIFTYQLPVPANYRVGVAVFEAGTNRPLVNHPTQNALLEGLQQIGFKTQNIFDLVTFKNKPSPEQACKMLAGKVDILILGDVSLKFSSHTDEFTFYRARSSLEGISTKDMRTLVTVDIEAKGGGLDDERAVHQALRKLAKKMRVIIGPAVEKKLE